MAATPSADQQLMARVAVGDSRAFATLFDRHAPKVLGLLIQLLRRRELAEEILQETFLQAWSQAARYRPQRATPAGWLLMLARSRALDRLRSARSRRRREEGSATDPTVRRSEPPLGTEALEEGERKTRVRDALNSLPDDQRRCLELAFYEGLSQNSIAERLELPLGTVKSRIRSAMTRMRSALRSYYET